MQELDKLRVVMQVDERSTGNLPRLFYMYKNKWLYSSVFPA